MAMKSNPQVSLSLEDKKQGCSQRVDTVDFTEGKPVKGWIAGIDFSVLLFRQIVKNRDGRTGTLRRVCGDLWCDGDELKTIDQKQWKVEVVHKTLKPNASMAKSPPHTVRTQSNPIFLSIYAAFRLEMLSSKLKMHHFQLREKIDMKALRSSLAQLRAYTGA